MKVIITIGELEIRELIENAICDTVGIEKDKIKSNNLKLIINDCEQRDYYKFTCEYELCFDCANKLKKREGL